MWGTAFEESFAVDVNGDGEADARWWEVTGSEESIVGHYAVMIEDEVSKGNINTARADPQPFELGTANRSGT